MKKNIIYLFLLSLFIVSCSTTNTGNKTMPTKFDRNIQPNPGPAPKINLGKPKAFTLDNGLKVIVVENHKLPRVSATLTIDNKPLFEGEKAGVSMLLSSILGSGTTTIPKDEFNEKVDFLGAFINYGSLSARMSSLSKFFSEVFTLMADGAQNPVFTQEEFDKEVAKAIDGIRSGEKSVKTIAARVENALAYGKNHPYGEFTTIESVKNIQLQDVKNLYNTYYKPNNAYLVIVGDVKFNQVKKLVVENFGNWKKGELPSYSLPKASNVEKTEVDFIDVPSASQSQVSVLSTTNLKMNDDDYHSVLVANQILGGDFNSYLNMNLREEHGFTYGARSSLRPNKYISKFTTSVQVRNEVVDSTIVETLIEIIRIRNEKVTAENLKTIKAGYTGKYVMAVEKPETVARYALNIEKNKLPADFYETYLEKINAVTVEDVQRIAQKYFNTDNARIVVTSKGADVIPAIEKLGYKINYYDKKGNPTTKPKMSSKIPTGVTARSVIDDYIEVIGGKEKVESLNSIEKAYEMTLQGMKLTQTMKIKNPNMINMETNIMGQTALKMVFDGQDGYMEQMGSKMPINEGELSKMKSKKGIIDELYLDKNDNQLKLIEIAIIEGNAAYKMSVSDGVIEEYKYFNVESKLLVKEEKIEKATDGNKKSIVQFFKDYKKVDGILFPHTINTNAMGEDVDMTLTKIELNKEFPEGTFK